jgi:hypothetical protein
MGISLRFPPATRSAVRRAAALFAAAALLLTACRGGDPYLDEYATSRPAETALVGAYRMQWQTATQDDPAALASAPARLVLAADGTFRAEGLPIFRPTNDAFAFDKLTDAEGRWELTTRGAVADGDSFLEIWGVRFTGGFDYDFAYVTGKQAPHGLLIHAGAPTRNAALYFVRE